MTPYNRRQDQHFGPQTSLMSRLQHQVPVQNAKSVRAALRHV